MAAAVAVYVGAMAQCWQLLWEECIPPMSHDLPPAPEGGVPSVMSEWLAVYAGKESPCPWL